jgi:glycosyltransferase involved in cell wall biosynthesis
MRTPDVSVLFPVRQGFANYPPDLFETVVLTTLHETGVNLEICFVDNASTDGTWGELQGLCDHYPNVKIARSVRDEGVAASLNRAASMATGRYLIFQSARSWYQPGALMLMAEQLDERSELGFVYGATQYHGLDERLHTPPRFEADRFRSSFDSLFGYMYRREAIEKGCEYDWYLFKEDQYIDLVDWDFAMQLIVKLGWKGSALPFICLHYYYSGQGQMTELVHRYETELMAEFHKRWGNA